MYQNSYRSETFKIAHLSKLYKDRPTLKAILDFLIQHVLD